MGEPAHTSSELGGIQENQRSQQQSGTSGSTRRTNYSQETKVMTQPMPTQQPFESKGPIMTEYITNGDKKLAQMLQHTHEPEPHTRMNRFEKLEFLQETTAFKKDTILNELIGWLTDDDFNQFYEDFCSNWDLCRSHEELNERYGD